VNSNDASIEVRSWERHEVEVRVTTDGLKIGPGHVQVTDRQAGDRIEVEVRRPHQVMSLSFHSYSLRIEVSVPREVNLDLHSGDGHIKVDDVKGEIRLDSSDGHLDGLRLDGSLRAHTSDGRIHVEGRFDALDVSTSDGSIEAEVQPGSKMSSGWSLHSGDGSITLHLPESLAADLDLHTGDGHIDMDLPVTVSGSLSRSTVRGKLNGGGFLLNVRTSDGSIHLGKS
jgi:DUF4097 and DUF4098 domain-containing protein YvlB